MPKPPHPTTRARGLVLGLAAAALAAIACSNKQDLRVAKTSAYDADFAIVYSEVLAAVRELYPTLDDDPRAGTIKTAWHQVHFSTGADDPRSVQQRDRTMGVGGQGPFGTTQSAAYKRLFIRFDISVVGGRPWRVRVSARASEWEPGNALPTELRGGNAPHWLPGRRDAMIVAIHRRLSKYAVPVEEAPPPDDEPAVPAEDPTSFGPIPPEAGAAVAAIVEAVAGRDLAALRARLADDVVWSLGAPGGADTALAMWQADPETLAALVRTLRAGCRPAGGDAVACPPEATEAPGYLGWRARLERRGDAWKLTSFVRGE